MQLSRHDLLAVTTYDVVSTQRLQIDRINRSPGSAGVRFSTAEDMKLLDALRAPELREPLLRLHRIRVCASSSDPQRFEVVEGERALEALRRLGDQYVDVEIVRAARSEKELQEMDGRIDRKAYGPWEEAQAIARFRALLIHRHNKADYRTIAARLGISKSRVGRAMRIVKALDPEILRQAGLSENLVPEDGRTSVYSVPQHVLEAAAREGREESTLEGRPRIPLSAEDRVAVLRQWEQAYRVRRGAYVAGGA